MEKWLILSIFGCCNLSSCDFGQVRARVMLGFAEVARVSFVGACLIVFLCFFIKVGSEEYSNVRKMIIDYFQILQ